MKIIINEHMAANMSKATGMPVMLIKLEIPFEEMDSKKIRDLADLKPIITDEAFDALIANQMVALAPENEQDVGNYDWMMSILPVAIPRVSAPVAILNFIESELADIISSYNYSVPSGITVRGGARKVDNTKLRYGS